jgi:hypothetical protein
MKNILLLILLYINDVNAQLRQYQDDGYAGSGYGSGGLVIVSIIVLFVLIFGGKGGRFAVFSIFLLFALPAGLGVLGNNIFPTPKIGGESSLAGVIGAFLGLYLWYKLMFMLDKKS